jgi:hypothetical protein
MLMANQWSHHPGRRHQGVWSTGEVIGVAVLLGSHGELAAFGESLQSALSRWAFDLWGLDGGQADVDTGCEATRQWFLDAANELDTNAELRELITRAAASPTVRRTRARRGAHPDRRDGVR